MTSPETLPPIVAAPEGLSDATKASAVAQYKAAGYDDSTLAAAGYGIVELPQVIADVQRTQLPGSNVAIMVGNGISHDQALSAAKHMLANGVDPAVVLEAAKAHGISEQDLVYTPPSKETVAAIQRGAATANSFAPPPEGKYELQYERSFAEASEPRELAALNRNIQSAFKVAEVPAALAQPLLDSILETSARYAGESMTDAARQMMFKEEGALFNKTSRNPAEDARLANLGYSVLPQAFREQLDNTYSLHSAKAQFQLAALGRALEYRTSKRTK